VWDIFYYIFSADALRLAHFIIRLGHFIPVAAANGGSSFWRRCRLRWLMILWGTLASGWEDFPRPGDLRKLNRLVNELHGSSPGAVCVSWPTRCGWRIKGVEALRNVLPAWFNWPLFGDRFNPDGGRQIAQGGFGRLYGARQTKIGDQLPAR